jgi:cytochrome c oxidase cbb3-type subunit 3
MKYMEHHAPCHLTGFRRQPLLWTALACLAASGLCRAQEADLTKSKETFQKVCSTCHTTAIITVNARTRAQWQDTIQKMIAAGAQGTDEDFAIVVNYLATQYGPSATAAPAGGRAGRGGRAGAPNQPLRTVGGGAGADDKQIVDDEAAERGRKVWAAQCINCHGTYARGTATGANLIRGDLVMHDRYGNVLGPFLRKGHPTQSGVSSATFTQTQIAELSHFLHQQIYNTLRDSPLFHTQDVLTGDAKAGAAYFNGEGGCNTCHSPTGDLKGIGSKYDPATMQGRFLNPRPQGGRRGGGGAPAAAAKQLTLTVTPPSGPPVTGTPVAFDDFDVSVRDSAGEYHSWKRTADLKIVRNDPYLAHDELLVKYTDKNMHDIVAYLVTLK